MKLLGNKTPKVHVAEDHAVKQFQRLPRGFTRFTVEQWVEVNHQEGKKNEEQFSRVVNLEDRANFSAANRHKAMNGEIKNHIKNVREDKKRGKYNKRKNESTTDESTSAVTPSPQKRSRNTETSAHTS